MEIINSPGIYRLVFPDGCYVGQSKNVKLRLKQHASKIAEGIHPNAKIRAGVSKYGEPLYEALEYCTLADLNAAEIHWMDVYDCYPDGYNLKPGGDFARPVERIELISTCTLDEQDMYMRMLIFPIIIGILFGFINVGLGIIVWFISFFIFYCRCH